MGNARTRETTLLIVQHPTLKLVQTCYTTHCPYFIFARTTNRSFLSLCSYLFLLLFFSFIPWIFFDVDESRTKKKKKKETHETPLFSLPCASLITRLSCVPFPFLFFSFFFQPATDLHPPLPQIIIIVSSVIITFLRTLSKRGEMYRMFRWNSN